MAVPARAAPAWPLAPGQSAQPVHPPAAPRDTCHRHSTHPNNVPTHSVAPQEEPCTLWPSPCRSLRCRQPFIGRHPPERLFQRPPRPAQADDSLKAAVPPYRLTWSAFPCVTHRTPRRTKKRQTPARPHEEACRVSGVCTILRSARSSCGRPSVGCRVLASSTRPAVTWEEQLSGSPHPLRPVYAQACGSRRLQNVARNGAV